MLDSLSGDVSKIEWRRLPVAIVMPLVSLFSGAVLGPEGGIGGISSKLAAHVQREGRDPGRAPAAARVLDAGLGLQRPDRKSVVHRRPWQRADPRSRRQGTSTLPANLIGGAIGYLIFISIGLSGLDNYLHLNDDPATRGPIDVVLVVVFGLLGLGLALIAGALFRVAAAIFGRFEGREVERALAAGVVFSVVGVFAPIVMFSGETQVQTVVADPRQIRPARPDRDGAGQAGAAGGRRSRAASSAGRRSRHLRVGLRRPRDQPDASRHPDATSSSAG